MAAAAEQDRRTPARGVNRDAQVLGDLMRHLATRGFRCMTDLPPSLRVARAEVDSRRVGPSDLFIALPGARTHGLEFAREALAAGAAAVLCDVTQRESAREMPAVFVDDVVRATGHVAALLAGEPARRLALVGVTGTNGKTSCTYLLESIWRAAGIPAGVGGTIVQRGPGFEHVARLTTPDAIGLQDFLAELVDADARWAALEVSSHALAQHRVAGVVFRAAVFTNLTRDHLDYHGTEEGYFAAKRLLFTEYLDREHGVAVLNADDPRSEELRRSARALAVVTYSGSGKAGADLRVEEAKTSLAGVRGTLVGFGARIPFASRLFGAANLANIAAVAATALATGVDPEAIGRGLTEAPAVPGRLERVGTDHPAVFVDYAHTPDALERTLTAVRELAPARLIVVFGCGGDRDRGKRPLMGGIAARLADVAVLTSDNPRSESPEAILAEIEAGIAGSSSRASTRELARPGARGYLVEADREAAIELAIELAEPADVVVIAGKGHEDYQEIGGVRRPFDDRAIAGAILRSR